MVALELQILIAFVLDLLIGDPRFLPHPVRGIGAIANAAERFARRFIGSGYVSGLFCLLTIFTTCVGTAWGLLHLATLIHPVATDLLSIYLIYSCVALQDLCKHSRDVYRALDGDDLAEARTQVSWIVGRDTKQLDATGVSRAAVESVAESFVDGVAAPLLFAVLFGPLGAVGYRVINTLDSMFGYRNERYLRFGWSAARLDDLANYIPARLSVPFMIFGAALLRKSPLSSWRILLRDGGKHLSPNSGLAEAAMAGALQVELGGGNFYGGRLVEKPTIGENIQPIGPQHILQANRLVVLAAVLFLGGCLMGRMLVVSL